MITALMEHTVTTVVLVASSADMANDTFQEFFRTSVSAADGEN